MSIHYAETKYGFEYGSVAVERMASDETKGCVVISLRTKRAQIQVYVTKTGLLRVSTGNPSVKFRRILGPTK